MLTVKLVYELSYVPDDLKWTTNIHDTIYTHFQGIFNNIYGLEELFSPSYLCPSIFVFTRPNDGWTRLYIKIMVSTHPNDSWTFSA